jgi:hypothetical protein
LRCDKGSYSRQRARRSGFGSCRSARNLHGGSARSRVASGGRQPAHGGEHAFCGDARRSRAGQNRAPCERAGSTRVRKARACFVSRNPLVRLANTAHRCRRARCDRGRARPWRKAVPAPGVIAVGAYALGGPIVHLAHRRPTTALGSFGLRVALAATGALVGSAGENCKDDVCTGGWRRCSVGSWEPSAQCQSTPRSSRTHPSPPPSPFHRRARASPSSASSLVSFDQDPPRERRPPRCGWGLSDGWLPKPDL